MELTYAWAEVTFKKDNEISLIAKRTSLNPMLGVYLYVAAESRTIQAPVVAHVLYLDNYGNFSNRRGLPPLAPHPYQRVMGGDIDRHHGGGLTGD